MVQDSQIGTLSHGELLQYGQNPYGIQSQGTGKDKQDFYTQIIDEIRHIDSTITVKLGKFEIELNKLASKLNALKNDRTFTEWCKVTNSRLESISNTRDRIERKC
ncbi:hypothetical protein O181_115428 [Austropuccinia psidii MF-1]|uniref:Uncharacterized protein n=1 Tax=Austropuccinia psidii MF-1 TaxID=1389203 RepID=A0A9Q3K6J5_9BASI|nr:hypothetical protein [Austropuccinia psidii MF-1]